MNATEFLKQLETTLRADADEKTAMYLKAEKELYSNYTGNSDTQVLERYRHVRKLWKLSVRKYDTFMESFNESKILMN